MFPYLRGGTSQTAQIIAPPPSPEVAGEVLAVAWQVLVGAVRLH